jgi:hypothetical protein
MECHHPVPDEEQEGRSLALFYHDSEQVVRTLMEKLERLSLKTLAGENIFTACSLIRGVMD